MPDEERSTSIERIEADLKRRGELYREFLRVPSMSVGLYVLPSGSVDPQTPHQEDEVYFVLRGRARFQLKGQDRPVQPGDVLFVPARDEHRFHSVVEELALLVIFAPAETPG